MKLSLHLFALCSVTLATATGCAVDAPSESEEATRSDLYEFEPALWTIKDIPVCWLNPQDAAAMGWVRDAVANSWSAAADIRFVGWGPCNPQTQGRGVRIRVKEARPFSEFGSGATRLPANEESMVLNFTFREWSRSCRNQREYCIRAIAIHEFGHALGFAHEQSRPDTPGTCMEEGARKGYGDNGVYLTAYDPQSVMNYCSTTWNNGGRLSALDIVGVQKVYGRR